MTWLEFWAGAAANTIGSVVGVVIGVPIALRMERTRQRHEEEAAREQREREGRELTERLLQRRGTMVGLLVRNLEVNLEAIERAEIDVGHDRTVYRADLELQTWDVLKPALVDLLDEPAFVARLATFFARLHEFSAMLALRSTWLPGYATGGYQIIKGDLTRFGPELRHHGRILLAELRALG